MSYFFSDKVDALVEELGKETNPQKRKDLIEKFHADNIKSDLRDSAQELVGKWLTRLFIALNSAVLAIILVFAILDVVYHIDDAENRFIDGGVLGALVTATIAEAVAAFLIFTKFVFNKS